MAGALAASSASFDGLLEAGAGWIDYWLGRLDAVYASAMGRTVSLKEKPSDAQIIDAQFVPVKF